jgi:hypothetical protein
MAWYSSGTAFPSINFNWINTNIAGATALSVKSSFPTSSYARLTWKEPVPSNPSTFYARDFYSDKNYLFKTTLRKFEYITPGMSFSISTAWNDSFIVRSLTPILPSSTTLYHHSSPDSLVTSTSYATYRANGLFGTATSLTNTPGVIDIQISELNWKVNGYMYCDNDQLLSVGSSSHTLGWRYIDSTTQSAYMWFDDANSTYYPVGGVNGSKAPSSFFRTNNFISKFVNFQFFNLCLFKFKFS